MYISVLLARFLACSRCPRALHLLPWDDFKRQSGLSAFRCFLVLIISTVWMCYKYRSTLIFRRSLRSWGKLRATLSRWPSCQTISTRIIFTRYLPQLDVTSSCYACKNAFDVSCIFTPSDRWISTTLIMCQLLSYKLQSLVLLRWFKVGTLWISMTTVLLAVAILCVETLVQSYTEGLTARWRITAYIWNAIIKKRLRIWCVTWH